MSYNRLLRSGVFAMSFMSSDDRVREEAQRAVKKKGEAKELPFVSPSATKLSAAKFEFHGQKKMRDLIFDINECVSEAAAAKSAFIAFPELTGLAFLSVFPRARRIAEELGKELSDPGKRKDLGYEFASQTQGCIGEMFFNAFSEIAKGNRMLIAAGGFYVIEDKTLRNRQYLFSETGEVLIYQDKLIPSPLESEMGLMAGEGITFADTRVGRCAMLTSSCAMHYEPFAAAAALGCRMVTAGASPFGEDMSLLSCRAGEQGLYVVSAGLSGEDAGLSVDSEPTVYFPRSSLRDRSTAAHAGRGEKSITVRVDLSGAASPDHYSSDRNPEFFKHLLENEL